MEHKIDSLYHSLFKKPSKKFTPVNESMINNLADNARRNMSILLESKTADISIQKHKKTDIKCAVAPGVVCPTGIILSPAAIPLDESEEEIREFLARVTEYNANPKARTEIITNNANILRDIFSETLCDLGILGLPAFNGQVNICCKGCDAAVTNREGEPTDILMAITYDKAASFSNLKNAFLQICQQSNFVKTCLSDIYKQYTEEVLEIIQNQYTSVAQEYGCRKLSVKADKAATVNNVKIELGENGSINSNITYKLAVSFHRKLTRYIKISVLHLNDPEERRAAFIAAAKAQAAQMSFPLFYKPDSNLAQAVQEFLDTKNQNYDYTAKGFELAIQPKVKLAKDCFFCKTEDSLVFYHVGDDSLEAFRLPESQWETCTARDFIVTEGSSTYGDKVLLQDFCEKFHLEYFFLSDMCGLEESSESKVVIIPVKNRCLVDLTLTLPNLPKIHTNKIVCASALEENNGHEVIRSLLNNAIQDILNETYICILDKPNQKMCFSSEQHRYVMTIMLRSFNKAYQNSGSEFTFVRNQSPEIFAENCEDAFLPSQSVIKSVFDSFVNKRIYLPELNQSISLFTSRTRHGDYGNYEVYRPILPKPVFAAIAKNICKSCQITEEDIEDFPKTSHLKIFQEMSKNTPADDVLTGITGLSNTAIVTLCKDGTMEKLLSAASNEMFEFACLWFENTTGCVNFAKKMRKMRNVK